MGRVRRAKQWRGALSGAHDPGGARLLIGGAAVEALAAFLTSIRREQLAVLCYLLTHQQLALSLDLYELLEAHDALSPSTTLCPHPGYAVPRSAPPTEKS